SRVDFCPGHSSHPAHCQDLRATAPEMELEVQWQEHELGSYPTIVLLGETPCAERRGIISQGARRLSPLMKMVVTFLAGRCHLPQEMTRMSSMTKPCIDRKSTRLNSSH